MDYSCIPPCDLPKMSPYSRTLNLEYLAADENSSNVKLIASPSTSIIGEKYLDSRCMVGLVDHAMGYTLQGAFDEMKPSTTINLRLDLLSSAQLTGDLDVRCQIQNRHSSVVLLSAEVTAQSGSKVAHASATFTQRNYPGKAIMGDFALTNYYPSKEVQCYEDAIGLQRIESGWCLQSACMGSIGWEPGNTFHGGAIGSLLMTSVDEALQKEPSAKRISTCSISYLRPTSIDRQLFATCKPIRLGNYASFYVAECYQDSPKKPVARAEFCCLAIK